MSKPHPTDITGTPIVPHALFVYATSLSSTVYMQWGRVEEIKPNGGVCFRGIERWGRSGAPELRERLTTMHSPEKTVVISWSHTIPDNIRRLLDPEGVHAAALDQVPPSRTANAIVG